MRAPTIALFVCSLVALAWPGDTVVAKPKATKEDRSHWTSLGISGGGAMYCPAISGVDPNLMMVNCDMSAAYISRDGGRSWEMIHADQLGGNTRCRPCWHPKERDTLLAASGWNGRLRVSRDAGRTFADLGNIDGGLHGEIHICRDKPELVFAGTDKAVWRSPDGGKNWKAAAGPTGQVRAFASGMAAPAKKAAPVLHVFVATSAGIWRSVDDGVTWAEATGGLPAKDVRSLAGCVDGGGGPKPKPGALYCCVPGTSDNGKYAGGIFKSEDLGQSWQSAMGEGTNQDTKAADDWAQGQICQYQRVLCASTDPNIVWAFNSNTGVMPPHHTAAFRSTDGGKKWAATFFPDPRMAGYNVDADYTTTGDGQFYQNVPEGVAICPTNPDIVIQVDMGCCIVTSNGGKSWFNGHCRAAKEKGFFENTGLVVTSVHHYFVDPHEPNRHYICYTDIGFARSLDAGKTWHWWGKNEKAPWRNTCYELAFDADKPGRIWGAFSNIHDIPNNNIIGGNHNANGPGGVCVSENFGETWVECKGLPLAPVTSICRAKLVLEKKGKPQWLLVAGVFGKGVFTSADDGKTWQERNGGLAAESNRRVCRVQAHKDGALFAMVTALRTGNSWSDESGLYRSLDAGQSWDRVNASQPLHWPKDFAVDPQDADHILIGAAAAAGKDEAGLWQTTDGGKTFKRVLKEGSEHFGASFSPHHKGWIYATLCEGADGPALWLSKDSGATWAGCKELPFRNVQRVDFDPNDEEVIYLATFGGSAWRGPAEWK